MNDIVEIGPFGPIYRQFTGKANEAIAFLLRVETGEALDALYHNCIGYISLVYGNDRYGIMKIKAKHPEVLQNLQEIVSVMKIIQQSENRIKLDSDTHFAVVSRDYFGKKHSPWLLTAFEKKNSVPDNTMDTGETLTGERNDTATPQDTVSADKDNKTN